MKKSSVKVANTSNVAKECVVSAAATVASVSPAKVRQTCESQLSASVEREKEIQLSTLRAKIVSRWSAGCFETSEEFAVVSAAVASLPDDLRERAISGARLAWLARPENAATSATIDEVVDHIIKNYSKEFERVCGCRCPSASAARLYSPTSLSVSTINEVSNVNDYLTTSAIPAGSSPSAIVSALMSVRFPVDVRRRVAAARAAARNELRESAQMLVRRAERLGVAGDLLARYLRILAIAVPASDDKERERLQKNLARCWSSLRTIENNIVLASPAGSLSYIEDGDGGWCFPASLPASSPAKVRKLWAKRVDVLSSISTIENLLVLGGK